MSLTLPQTCNMGSSQTGLVGTIGVELLNPDGTTKTARATAGIYEIGGGTYGVEIAFDDNWSGVIVWDTGGGTPYYAAIEYNLEGLSDNILERVSLISSGTAATNVTASSAVVTAGTETNTYTSAATLDGVLHSVAPPAGTTDFYYLFNVGANGVPVGIQWEGYANSQGDSYLFQVWNYTTSAWDTVKTVSGAPGSVVEPVLCDLTTSHVGTGANIGDVKFRIYSTDGTNISTDRVLCSFSTVYKSVGYSNGAIWIDTSVTNTDTESYIDGVADNPVSTLAAALTLSTQVGLKRFQIVNGSSITLSSDVTNFEGVGENWDLDLNGQTIDGVSVLGATVTGTGLAVVTTPVFKQCFIGAVTLPPSKLYDCGIGLNSGTFTGGSAGNYDFLHCHSLVPGSGTPNFVFSGLAATTGINNRDWQGGVHYTLDSDCTISHEVSGGGKQTFVTGGADVEFRGIAREIVATLSGAGTVQLHGVVGDITLSGAATTVVNISGVSTIINDSSTGTTVTDNTISQEDIEYLLTQLGLAGAGLTDLGGMSAAMKTEVGDAVLDEVCEGSYTMRQILRGFLSVLAGKTAGGGSATLTFRDAADAKDRITATVDSNKNRTAMTLDLT